MLKSFLHSSPDAFIENVQRLTVKDVVYLVVDAWQSFEYSTLQNAWKKLKLGSEKANDVAPNVETEPESAESVFEGFTEDEIQQWMKCDEADPAYHLLDDEEIVDDVNGNNSDKRESVDEDNETKAAVSHSEAMESFQKGLDWLEQQPKAETTQLLLVRSLIAMAAKKRSFRQTRIQDFFAPTQ
ncbi:UNVERIFIED_CONTAM: hypothetical protein FKN15_031999 [Acipenser sinensis]